MMSLLGILPAQAQPAEDYLPPYTLAGPLMPQDGSALPRIPPELLQQRASDRQAALPLPQALLASEDQPSRIELYYRDRVFILYPDGSAQPLGVNAWNYRPVFVPPGSTIMVPRDPKPFDFMQTAKDVSQILSNLAITALAADDLGDE